MIKFANFITVRLNRTKFVLCWVSWIGKLQAGLSSLSGCFPGEEWVYYLKTYEIVASF